MSEAGRTARDVLLGLMKTCRKLGVSFYRYLGDRLRVPGRKTSALPGATPPCHGGRRRGLFPARPDSAAQWLFQGAMPSAPWICCLTSGGSSSAVASRAR
jgi:hypothetical protein